MSLYGTGRREGIVSALFLAGITALVHVLGSVQVTGLHGPDLLAALRGAAVPALGGMLFYRFLRAQGRSRYAGFLGGLAYAMSPWLVAVAAVPREQLAAALAPLALEAASRWERPPQRRRWMPWTACCLALPFLAGASLVAALAAMVALVQLRLALRGTEEADRAGVKRAAFVCGGLAAIAAASLLWIDPFGPLLGIATPPSPAEVLAAHRSGHHGLDAAALLRLPGPALLMFGALGVLRRQRHAAIAPWLLVAIGGAVPTLLAPHLPAAGPGLLWHLILMLPTAAWWLTLLAIAVLGAAGLDDFLDLPLRRRTALPWLLAFAVAGAPLIPTFGSHAPEQEWPLTATFLLLAVLLPFWRRIGILQFKNVLAIATVLALAVPALQVLPVGPGAAAPAMPGVETAPATWSSLFAMLAQRPAWHYAGLCLVLACCGGWALSARRRSRKAMPTPATAKAAITKKARPAQRS